VVDVARKGRLRSYGHVEVKGVGVKVSEVRGAGVGAGIRRHGSRV